MQWINTNRKYYATQAACALDHHCIFDCTCRVARVVAPKKAKLKEAEAALAVAMKALEKKRADLRTVQQKLADLQASFDENNRKKQQLEHDVDMCSKKLDRCAAA